MRNLFVRILAYFCIALGSLILISALIGIIYFWFSLVGANIFKKLLFELLVLVIGLFGFLTGVGLYQYIITFLHIEEEIEKIEQEEKEIKEDITELKGEDKNENL